jgi:hypothetical protein
MLVVLRDTYQTLGLPGRSSRYGPPDERFGMRVKKKLTYDFSDLVSYNVFLFEVIEIDLREESMRAGKAGYERTRTCLGRSKKFSMMFSFCDQSGTSGCW